MQKTKSLACLYSLLLAIFSVSALQAEESEEPKPLLESGDIAKLIETYPKIARDFEALGHSLAARQNLDLEDLKDLESYAAVQQLLKKHGWNAETFFPKFMAIVSGYTGLHIEEQLRQLPAQQRAMAESMMRAQMPEFDVHPQDLQLIKKNLGKLNTFFENLE